MNKITLSDLGQSELISPYLEEALEKIGVHVHADSGASLTIENSRASDMLDNLEMTVKYSKNDEELNREFITLAEDWKSEYFRTEEPPLSDTNPFTIWKRNHQEAPPPNVLTAAYVDALKKHAEQYNLTHPNPYIKAVANEVFINDREPSLLQKSRRIYDGKVKSHPEYADAALGKVPPSLESLVVTGYNDICKVPLDFTGYVENRTVGVVKVFHDLDNKGYIEPNVRAYFLNGKFVRTQLTPAVPHTLSDLSLQPDSLAAHHALAEHLRQKQIDEAALQALLTESEVVLRIPAPTKPYVAPTPPDPTPLVPFESVTWGDPVRKVQFIDTYERFIPAKPKEARDITISRALLCEGSFNEVDVELLEQEVSANYAPFQYEGEYLSAWGYEPTTDEVTLRFLKGQS